MKKHYKYRIRLEEDAVGGRASLLMAGLSALFLLVGVIISLVYGGKAALFVGAFGLAGFLMAGAGFYTGMTSFREERKNHRYSTAGSLLCGLLTVFWLALLLIGIS